MVVEEVMEVQIPLKTKNFMCLALNNKVLTWGNLQKINMDQARVLCARMLMNLVHLLVSFSSTKKVWQEVEEVIF
jgi:hypothetical protein